MTKANAISNVTQMSCCFVACQYSSVEHWTLNQIISVFSDFKGGYDLKVQKVTTFGAAASPGEAKGPEVAAQNSAAQNSAAQAAPRSRQG